MALAELVGRPQEEQLSRVQEGDPVGHAQHAGDVVADDDARRARPVARVHDELVDRIGRDGIEAARRLVVQQDFGFHRQRPGQADPFAHAATQFVGHQAAVSLKADGSQLLVNDPGCFLLTDVPLSPNAKEDVVTDVEVIEQGRVLEDHSHPLTGSVRLPFDADAVHDDVAGRDGQESRNALEERGLSAAAASHDDEHLASTDSNVNVEKHLPSAIGLAQVVDREHRDDGVYRGLALNRGLLKVPSFSVRTGVTFSVTGQPMNFPAPYDPALGLISAMITPALMILGSSSLLSTALQRMGRDVDRARALIREAKGGLLDPISARDLERYRTRSGIAVKAVMSLTSAVGVLVLDCLFIAANQLLENRIAWLPVSATIAGMSLVLAGAFLMVRESQLAWSQISAEILSREPESGP